MSATAPQEMGKRVAGSFALSSMVNVLPALAIVSIDMILSHVLSFNLNAVG